MKKQKKEFNIKKSRKFIQEYFDKCMSVLPFKWDYKIKFYERKVNSFNGYADIQVDPLNLQIELIIFSDIFHKNKKEIMKILEHEAGHVLLSKFSMLAENRFLTEKEFHLELEVTASEIGILIGRILVKK